MTGALVSGVLFLPLLGVSARWLPTGLRAFLFILLAGLVILDLTALRHIRFPQNGRQVPQSIAHAEPAVGAFRFGVEMGTGLRTFSPSGLPHLLLGGLLLVGRIGVVVPAALGFGLGRALMTRGAIVATQPWVTHWDERRALVSWLGLVIVLLPVLAWLVAR